MAKDKYNKDFLRADTFEDAMEVLPEINEANPDAVVIVEEEGKECMIEHGKQLNFVPSDVDPDKLRQITDKEDKFNIGTGLEMTQDRTLNVTLDTTIFKVVNNLPEQPDEGDENKIHLIVTPLVTKTIELPEDKGFNLNLSCNVGEDPTNKITMLKMTPVDGEEVKAYSTYILPWTLDEEDNLKYVISPLLRYPFNISYKNGILTIESNPDSLLPHDSLTFEVFGKLETNIYSEYLWVEGAWELLGTLTPNFDLSELDEKYGTFYISFLDVGGIDKDGTGIIPKDMVNEMALAFLNKKRIVIRWTQSATTQEFEMIAFQIQGSNKWDEGSNDQLVIVAIFSNGIKIFDYSFHLYANSNIVGGSSSTYKCRDIKNIKDEIFVPDLGGITDSSYPDRLAIGDKFLRFAPWKGNSKLVVDNGNGFIDIYNRAVTPVVINANFYANVGETYTHEQIQKTWLELNPLSDMVEMTASRNGRIILLQFNDITLLGTCINKMGVPSNTAGFTIHCFFENSMGLFTLQFLITGNRYNVTITLSKINRYVFYTNTNTYSDLTTPALAMARSNSKNLGIEAGKQYFNEVQNRIITVYNGFSSENPTATILSSAPIIFEGDNVLTPTEIPDSDYLLYKIEYVQTSDIKYILVVSVTPMKAPQGGLKGEDIPVANETDTLLPSEGDKIIDLPNSREV